MVKVHLCNLNAILSRAGFGEGATHAEALAAALDLAHMRGLDARYNPTSGQVEYRGVVRL